MRGKALGAERMGVIPFDISSSPFVIPDIRNRESIL